MVNLVARALPAPLAIRPGDRLLEGARAELARRLERAGSRRSLVVWSAPLEPGRGEEPGSTLHQDAVDWFARALALRTRAALWLAPGGEALVAAGIAWSPPPGAWTRAGDEPDRAAAASWTAALRRLAGSADPGAGPASEPILVGGLAFDPGRGGGDPTWKAFPACGLAVPRVLLRWHGGLPWLTLSALAGPAGERELARTLAVAGALLSGDGPDEGSQSGPPPVRVRRIAELPDRDGWRRAVERALREIRAGVLHKLVIARRVELQADAAFRPEAVLRRLAAAQPDVYVFAFRSGARCFVGASPERLVRVAGGTADVDCLAGSAPRGADGAEDARIAAALLASPKDRREHALVLDFVREALAPVASRVDAPAAPRIRSLGRVQHLHTPVRARLQPGAGVLDLVARLHPTPAVCGQPRQQALAFLRREEPFERGWYAGPVGWAGAGGDGEFAVAIRSGILAGRRAVLFAGCGIVEGSDPDREYAETEWKLAALEAALEASGA